MKLLNLRFLPLPLLLAALTSGCNSGPSKAELDAEVRRLCAIDGGVKVYETVALPAEMFNEWGQINFYRPDKGEDALGREYAFKSERAYIRRGNPEMWRSHYELVRRSDGKTLGTSTSYSRRGGDMPGPWHESSFGCPENRGDVPFLTSIFVKQE
jgi:hypothetical protein